MLCYTEFCILFMKPLIFAGSSLSDIREFPLQAKRDAGYQLSQIQLGFDPSDWKPMQSVGSGVREIRLHNGGEFRVIYITKLYEAVYVLHAFQKKAQKTPKREIELARSRLKLIQEILV
jgi:phage-related protein